jgi:hypothetical protein
MRRYPLRGDADEVGLDDYVTMLVFIAPRDRVGM